MVEIALQISIHASNQREYSDVEFSLFVEQGLLTVLLDDVGALLSVDNLVRND